MTERGPRGGSGRRGRGCEQRPFEERAEGRRAGGDGTYGERPSGARAYEECAGGGPGDGRGDRALVATPADDTGVGAAADRFDAALVRIRDLAGRPRGLGFLADHEGTLLTSHEAVDGLPRLVLHAGDRTCVVGPDAVTALPGLGLALVRTEGLGVEPLPLTVRERIDAGTYVHVAAGCWREARVLAATQVTYTATDRFHLLDDALELAIGTAGRDALRLGGGAAGGPVLDARTGAVVGVLGTALHSAQRDAGFAVPLRPADGPLADLLARNAATVPAYGADLNIAGILQLTMTSVGQDGPASALEPVERPDIVRELAAFAAGDRPVLGLVGAPGSGRTTELVALAARRARGERPAPTLWLRGADLKATDDSVADVARRTLARAARIIAASRSGRPECLGDVTPEHVARFAARTGRPLLLLLDGPEEMPPALADRLPVWTRGTAAWLTETGTRLVVACREEHWERTGRAFPEDLLHVPGTSGEPVGVPADGGEPLETRAAPGSATDGGEFARTQAGPGTPASGDEPLATRAGAGAPWRCPGPDRAPVSPVSPGHSGPTGPGGRGEGAELDRASADPAAQADGTGPVCTSAGPAAPADGAGPVCTSAGPAAPAGGGEPLRSTPVGPPGSPLASAGPAEPLHAVADRAPSPGAQADGVDLRTPLPSRVSPVDVGEPDHSPADLASPAGGPEPHHSPADPASPADGPLSGRTCATSGPATQAFPPPGESVPGEASRIPATDPLPPCLRIGDFTLGEARWARARYGIPKGALGERDARHPLVLRLLSEVRAAVPDAPVAGPLDRHDVFAAYLDLMCLRIAVRLAAAGGPRGTAVRRLAARVAGQVHEAARRSLGPGQGELDRESFEAVFPWGPAPARLGGGTGWASAVLTEGLLVPAGTGYRFAHEELADWLQGTHLDLDAALRALVHRAGEPSAPRPVPSPVPHHRVGPVVQALLLLARQQGAEQLSLRLRELVDALDRDTGSWWAARLLARTLLQVPDATPYTEVLRLLADRVVAWRGAQRPVPADFRPAFWTGLPVPDTERLDLLRRLVLADPAPPVAGERYLDAVAALLAAAPTVVQPLLTRWFTDERPLPATPHATVATAAQALLHTHRHGALDDLTEVLVACAHRRADELLAVLAEDEPSALCRAVDRWAHDERPARRVAAVAFALRAAPHARSDADRELLRYAALTLLARPADRTLHGAALALLVRDPRSRDRHLPAALRHFADGDPQFPPSALVPALTTHPEPVLEAFRARLCAPGAGGPDTAAVLRSLTQVATPALARRVATLVREALRLRPETAGSVTGQVAGQVDRRLEQGPTARPVLLPLVTGLLGGGPEPLRAALATVLAAPGTPASLPLRRELLEVLLAREEDPSVLLAVLHAATEHGGREEGARGLVHRTGLLLVRTPEGATRFDRALVDIGRHVPGFAARMARWLTEAPDDWVAVVGPSARRMIENLAGVRVPA
ncbi:trypsin-like peptidase domain-containing protein [Streptomyces sp. NRRL WC-3744]|uniref:trypsin-like peptidase domain-containing protein n=1 Tax=Streptomyces sp. NRRL WC-3744 TaxID=1463935 RepID=UPI0004C83D9D|nr:trypsin-like peptidase domain-containing protein [Streptomyces sp. NRRL WC-3744]